MDIGSPEEQAVRNRWAAEDAAWEDAQIARAMEENERVERFIARMKASNRTPGYDPMD